MLNALDRGLELAREHGAAVVIGHPRPATLAALAAWTGYRARGCGYRPSGPVAGQHQRRRVRPFYGDTMIERTFSIIKPDAVARNLSGEILAMIQQSGLRIKAMKMIQLTRAQAEGFYAVHKERPFFNSLVEYMCSGPVVCSILEGEDAIRRYRDLMGAHQPGQRGRRHHPQKVRRKYRGQLRARLRRSGNRGF